MGRGVTSEHFKILVVYYLHSYGVSRAGCYRAIGVRARQNFRHFFDEAPAVVIRAAVEFLMRNGRGVER